MFAFKTAVMDKSKDNEKNKAAAGMKNFLHGNMYQIKLIMLYLLRGIEAGYAFELGTEMPNAAGKLDDIIFKYHDDIAVENRWIFIQAKHRQNADEKIKTKDLFDKTANFKTNKSYGDFELVKYYKSYHKEIRKWINQQSKENSKTNNIIENCSVVTNIGFDENDLKENGFHLSNVDDVEKANVLYFNVPTEIRRVRLSFEQNVQTDLFDYIKQNSEDANNLAKEIIENIKKKITFSKGNSPLFKMYFKALRDNNVILVSPNRNCIIFNEDFLDKNVKNEKGKLRNCLKKKANEKDLVWDTLRNKEIKVSDTFFKKNNENYSPHSNTTSEKKLPSNEEELDKLAGDILNCAYDYDPNIETRNTRSKTFSSEFAPALIRNKVLQIQGKCTANFHLEFIRGEIDSDFRKAFKTQVESYWANDLLETEFKVTKSFGKSEQDTGNDDTTHNSLTTSPLFNEECKSSLALEFIKQLTCFAKSATPISLRVKIMRDCHNLLVKDKIIKILDREKNTAKIINKDFIMNSLNPNAWETFMEDATFTISDPFFATFMIEDNDKNGVTELPTKEISDEELNDFFENKFTFVINTPNEVELDDVLNEQIGKHFNVFQSQHLTSFILEYMLNWVKSKESKFLNPSQARKEILNTITLYNIQKKVTGTSLEYLRKINFYFNENFENYAHSSRNRSRLLELLVNYIKFNSNGLHKVFFISSPLPKASAVKLVLALRDRNRLPYRIDENNKFAIDITLNERYQREDSFLILKSKYITRDQVNSSYKVLKTMQQNNSHFLLVIVLETCTSRKELDIICQFVRQFKGITGKKMILIGDKEILNKNSPLITSNDNCLISKHHHFFSTQKTEKLQLYEALVGLPVQYKHYDVQQYRRRPYSYSKSLFSENQIPEQKITPTIDKPVSSSSSSEKSQSAVIATTKKPAQSSFVLEWGINLLLDYLE
jgi:hypothetical protein